METAAAPLTPACLTSPPLPSLPPPMATTVSSEQLLCQSGSGWCGGCDLEVALYCMEYTWTSRRRWSVLAIWFNSTFRNSIKLMKIPLS